MTSPLDVARPPRRLDRWAATVAPFLGYYQGPIAPLLSDPSVANFAVGNPQEPPMPAYVDALRRHLEPQDKDWFAYKFSEPNATAAVARSLAARTGLEWDPADVAMTNGGFAAIAVALRALLEPGDEVVFLSPPWFFYELLILAAEGVPVRVRLDPPAFDIDPAVIEAAITPRTRVVLVNSPHNPSGRVYPLQTWQALATTLERATARNGSPIYLVSDEPYNRIVFDGRRFHSPAEAYPRTVITYSYGKTLLAPGQRIGYLTWPPTMPERESLRLATVMSQLATGFAFPNALLQHAIDDLEALSIDIGALERRRDRLVPALAAMGYEPTTPEGTFYVMARAPIEDDGAFAEALARHRVLVLPGSIVEVPGWFRISLTATDAMVERGLEGFAAAMREARG
jgi:aspartate aminotransferase